MIKKNDSIRHVADTATNCVPYPSIVISYHVININDLLHSLNFIEYYIYMVKNNVFGVSVEVLTLICVAGFDTFLKTITSLYLYNEMISIS